MLPMQSENLTRVVTAVVSALHVIRERASIEWRTSALRLALIFWMPNQSPRPS
jgi:hypothetical protein